MAFVQSTPRTGERAADTRVLILAKQLSVCAASGINALVSKSVLRHSMRGSGKIGRACPKQNKNNAPIVSLKLIDSRHVFVSTE